MKTNIYNINSWHQLNPSEKRIPSKRQSKKVAIVPDVYPQDPKQEEDILSADRLKRGFLLPVIHHEYDSFVFNPRLPLYEQAYPQQSSSQRNQLEAKRQAEVKKFDNGIGEDGLFKMAKTILLIQGKKAEVDVINLQKKRTKDISAESYNYPCFKKDPNRQPWPQWFEELASPKKSLQKLIAKATTDRQAAANNRIPLFKNREEFLDVLFKFKVPIDRAIWYAKACQFGDCLCDQQKRSKKISFSDYPMELSKLCIKYLKDLLEKIAASTQNETSTSSFSMWPYFACFFKHAFEEGILDRQEFLMDLCDLLNEHSNFSPDKHHIFRILVIFVSQFLDIITQNVILSRLYAYVLASRLKQYQKDFEKKRTPTGNANDVFIELTNCQHHKSIVLTCFGILQAIIIDCPSALIWNPFDPKTIPYQLCGSPLDQLPCPADTHPLGNDETAQKIRFLINARIDEIKQRSRNVENHWSLYPPSQNGFEEVVDVACNILGVLDMAVLNEPKAFNKLYVHVFRLDSKERFEHETAIRVKILLQWAITSEREGSHRAIVVCKLLKMRLRHFRNSPLSFGRQSLQDILVEFVTKESPTPVGKNFHREYANFMLLFFELQRFGLFSHEAYVRALLRCGKLNYQEPVMSKFKEPAKPESSTDPTITTSVDEKPPPNPAIISFIPTTMPTSSSSSSESSRSSIGSSIPGSVLSPSIDVANLLDDEKDEHILMDSPNSTTKMSVHNRFLIQLPIEQTEKMRDACNQRAIVLHGISDEREKAKQELKKVAKEICRIWQKRISVEFFENSKEVRVRRRSQENLNEVLTKFRSQTYYDQVVICGWCAESFIDLIQDFLFNSSYLLPIAECLDLLLSMMETCQNYYGIITLAVELLPLLIAVERKIGSFRSDCIPGTVACQLSYVLVAYLADHYYYFLYTEEASTIVNGLYRVVEKELIAKGYPITCWARAVAIFVLHAKNDLLNANLQNQPLLGRFEDFKAIFPDGGQNAKAEKLKYNQLLFTDILNDPKRFYCYHDYKIHLPSIENDDTKYSFVVNAFKAVKHCVDKEKGSNCVDFDKLCELANICGHISAQKQISAEWYVAIQELCYSSVSTQGYIDLLSEVNAEDFSTHYSLATFIILLCSKYVICSHALIVKLIHNVFVQIFKEKQDKPEQSSIEGAAGGLCLALLIVTNLVCGSDEPFHLSSAYHGGSQPKKLITKNADLRGLRIIHIRELDVCIFPLLSAVSILNDTVKKFSRNEKEDTYKINYLLSICKCSLLAMCEQEWVIQRVFRVCESKEDSLKPFRCPILRRNNAVGEQLIRIGLRRKNERNIKQKLMACNGNGNGKKSVIDMIFSVLNVWNIRASFYDLKLMIKEIVPEEREKGSNKHAQQIANYIELFCEMGRCCRDLFKNSHKDGNKLSTMKTGSQFRLSQIDCYWLIAPLVNVIPRPDNIPSSCNQLTVKSEFLKEAAILLAPSSDTNENAINEKLIIWLLSQQPFLNLILTCLNSEEQERDKLVNTVLKYIQGIVKKVGENPMLPYQSTFGLEREGLLLRLNLIGGMFDYVKDSSNSSDWMLALFQLMFYGIISPDREREYFDACYDMFTTILIGEMSMPNGPSSTQSFTVTDSEKKIETQKNRLNSAYNKLVSKIKKEVADRTIPPELHCLAQLLPVPKTIAELSAWDAFTSTSPPKNVKTTQTTVANISTVQGRSGRIPVTAIRLDKAPHFAQKHVMRLLYHTHYNDFPHPGIVGQETDHLKDVFLSQPLMERSDSVYQYLTGTHQQQQQLALPSSIPQPPNPIEPIDHSVSQRPRPANLQVQQNFPGNYMKTQGVPPAMMGMSGPGSVSSNETMTPTFVSPTQPIPPSGMGMPGMGIGIPTGMPMHMGMGMEGRGPGQIASPNKGGRGRRRSSNSNPMAKQPAQKRRKDIKATVMTSNLDIPGSHMMGVHSAQMGSSMMPNPSMMNQPPMPAQQPQQYNHYNNPYMHQQPGMGSVGPGGPMGPGGPGMQQPKYGMMGSGGLMQGGVTGGGPPKVGGHGGHGQTQTVSDETKTNLRSHVLKQQQQQHNQHQHPSQQQPMGYQQGPHAHGGWK